MIADVVNPMRHAVGVLRWAPVENCDDPFHDIVDVREVSSHVAVVIYIDRLAGDDRLVNLNVAISGRPHGPYTVKNRSPVAGTPNCHE